METELIRITEYCTRHHTEPAFIDALEQSGLIEVVVAGEERWIGYDQLPELENYTRWYYELDINVAGIEVVRHLLDRITHLQQQVRSLEERLRRAESNAAGSL